MKKYIFFTLFFLSFNHAYTDSGTSTASWSNISGEPIASFCGTSTSNDQDHNGAIVHKGIPFNNIFNVGTSGGSVSCITHSYFLSSHHTVGYGYNTGMTPCPTGEMVVSWVGGNMVCSRYDDTPPSSSNVTVTSDFDTSGYHTATDNKYIEIDAGTSYPDAPIVLIEGQFENNNDETAYNGIKKSDFDLNSPEKSKLQTNENISNISISNNDFLEDGNYRDYSYEINKVCDEAGNCIPDIAKDFIYHVYAEDIDSGNSGVTGEGNFTNQIADGIEKTLTIDLKDEYHNKVVPVDEFDGTSVRNLSLMIDYDNDLYLNQLAPSSLFPGITLTEFMGPVTSFSNSVIGPNSIQSTNIYDTQYDSGLYDIKFKVYSPTENTNVGTETKAIGGFAITDISGRVNSNLIVDINDSDIITFQFKPIYYTELYGWLDPDNNVGFRENFTQTGTIDISKNPTLVDPSLKELSFVKYGTDVKDNFTGLGEVDNDGQKNIISTGIGTTFIETTFNTSFSYIFKTFFRLISGGGSFADDINDLTLREYIKYEIDNKEIVYQAGVVNEGSSLEFDYLKVHGISNIDKDKQEDIISGHDSDDIHNLAGEITKASLKRDIRKSTINTIKFVDSEDEHLEISDLGGTIWNDINNGGKALGNILYYDVNGGTDVVLDAAPAVEGRKTIVVRGGNLYIKSDILNSSSSDILGIILLEDDNGNGGKLYIDNNVLRIDAVIYAEKSIISYNDIDGEIDGSMGLNDMLNQLYIYGSIFSENTIGGSRKSPAVCPFWTESDGSIDCEEDAQKYDLNYLRGGYNVKYDNSYGNYPIIIKYNPAVQNTPPPLFVK